MYGISYNSITKNYILVFQILQGEQLEIYCEVCYEKYTDVAYNWCKPCHINYLKNNFTSWTSGNEKIDDFIQKMQFEWIPYN